MQPVEQPMQAAGGRKGQNVPGQPNRSSSRCIETRGSRVSNAMHSCRQGRSEEIRRDDEVTFLKRHGRANYNELIDPFREKTNRLSAAN